MKQLTHEQVWMAIDRLADRYGYSASGLAKKAGLDATSFNKSKRIAGDGHQRWPSTESVAKVLDATGASVEEFIALLGPDGQRQPEVRLPLISSTAAGQAASFKADGRPGGADWDELSLPGLDDPRLFAMEVVNQSFEPLYRQGDRLVLSPAQGLRPNDKVALRLATGEVMVRELKRSTAKTVELKGLRPGDEDITLTTGAITWIARIVWASQ